MDFSEDKFNEECGVFGVFGHEEAAPLAVLGLHALQHRGQEACGIVTIDGKDFHAHRALGLVGSTLNSPEVVQKLAGSLAIGHNRYSTSGEPSISNVQPMFAETASGGFAVAHNGNLTNAATLRRKLVEKGAIFQSSSDTEVIVHLVARAPEGDVPQRLVHALKQIKGAYSLVACAKGQLVGLRDPHGVRPLVLGRIGKAYVLASETCALDMIGAEYDRDVQPGEMVVITDKGMISSFPFKTVRSRFCIFEYIYFARPDSFIEGRSVYEARKQIGVELAKEAPVPGADLVVPVPDSGTPSAIGYAQKSKIPFELGIIRSHYIGRTFIQPTDSVRYLGVRLKHNANKSYLKGKKVVLVDDSIVRGTTSRKIVEMVREAGASEVHMRISSPPTRHSCFYGIDTPSSEELMAHSHSSEEICKKIGADSLSYISYDGLYKAVNKTKRNSRSPQFCDACFTGDYPIELTDRKVLKAS